jgi:hypothetical protein
MTSEERAGTEARATRDEPPRRPDTGGRDFRRRPRALVVVAGVLVLLVAAGLVARLVVRPSPPCQQSFIPAFFPADSWSRVNVGGNSPSVIILNPASGPGAGPNDQFKDAVDNAKAKGTTVIGYIGTNYGLRPLAQVETWIRQYRQWYGVKGIFLDQAPTSGTAQLGYYKTLSGYIHTLSPGAPVWLNPGVYPNRGYMSVATVVMAFEGPYQTYLSARIPKWARHYAPDRFAHTVFATPQSRLASVIRLSRSRNAGYVYVTDDVPPDPYKALPTYWQREEPAVAANCGTH